MTNILRPLLACGVKCRRGWLAGETVLEHLQRVRRGSRPVRS